MKFDKIRAALDKIPEGYKTQEAHAGWLGPDSDDEEKQPEPDDKKGPSLAYIASIQEFGSPEANIPARPFIRPTVMSRRKEWAQLLKQGIKRSIEGQMKPREVLGMVGEQAAGDIRAKISEIWSPPLAESTVKARARRLADHTITESLRKPLVDTGAMRVACISQVVDKE